jgi:hypothetical protein
MIEILLFIVMYVNYETHKSADVANSFGWHNSIVYARGVLPVIGLMSINDKIFSIKDPIFICLFSAIIVDYVVLFICTTIANWVKNK